MMWFWKVIRRLIDTSNTKRWAVVRLDRELKLEAEVARQNIPIGGCDSYGWFGWALGAIAFLHPRSGNGYGPYGQVDTSPYETTACLGIFILSGKGLSCQGTWQESTL